MKKIVVIVMVLFIVCGCNNTKNSLIESNYINENDYSKIYNDLLEVAKEVSFIPSEENEKRFYELIEVISNNCRSFSNTELEELYNLMNINYQFIYSGRRYNNSNYKNDLNIIKNCKTE